MQQANPEPCNSECACCPTRQDAGSAKGRERNHWGEFKRRQSIILEELRFGAGRTKPGIESAWIAIIEQCNHQLMTASLNNENSSNCWHNLRTTCIWMAVIEKMIFFYPTWGQDNVQWVEALCREVQSWNNNCNCEKYWMLDNLHHGVMGDSPLEISKQRLDSHWPNLRIPSLGRWSCQKTSKVSSYHVIDWF